MCRAQITSDSPTRSHSKVLIMNALVLSTSIRMSAFSARLRACSKYPRVIYSPPDLGPRGPTSRQEKGSCGLAVGRRSKAGRASATLLSLHRRDHSWRSLMARNLFAILDELTANLAELKTTLAPLALLGGTVVAEARKPATAQRLH